MAVTLIYTIDGEDSTCVPNACELPLDTTRDLVLRDVVNALQRVNPSLITEDFQYCVPQNSRPPVLLDHLDCRIPFDKNSGIIELLLYLSEIPDPKSAFARSAAPGAASSAVPGLQSRGAIPAAHVEAPYRDDTDFSNRGNSNYRERPYSTETTGNHEQGGAQGRERDRERERERSRARERDMERARDRERIEMEKKRDREKEWEWERELADKARRKAEENAALAAAALNEAAESVKEAAGAAAKSLFSFAAMSMKTVVEAATAAAGVPGGAMIGRRLTIGSKRVEVVRQLAEGGFGIVYLAQDAGMAAAEGSSGFDPPSTGGAGYYALKQLNCQSREQVAEAKHELDVLLRFRGNPYIITLLENAQTSPQQGQNTGGGIFKEVLMLFPLYTRGTAWDAIERATATFPGSIPWPFPELRALFVTLCMAQALQALHAAGFAHRDVKPHNVLLSEGSMFSERGRSRENRSLGPDDYAGQLLETRGSKFLDRLGMGRAVVMDLGSVSAARVQITTKQQALQAEDEAASKTSAAYRAPELCEAQYPPAAIDERVDVFGLGCSLYCLAFGRSPFETPREGVSKLAILNGKYTLPAHYCNTYDRATCPAFSDDFVALVGDMLQVDPQKRPFAQEVAERCVQLIDAQL